MRKMTSALANKLLKQIADEKDYLTTFEQNNSVWFAAAGEHQTKPDYDFKSIKEQISECDRKTAIIKHAINLANVSNRVSVGDAQISVDTLLVRMAQLNKRKEIYNAMRKHPERIRKDTYSPAIEYEYINYDIADAKAAYDDVSRQIMDMQIALDKYNQTFEFDIDI